MYIAAVERAGLRNLIEGQKISFELETGKRSGKKAAIQHQSTRGVAPQALGLSRLRSPTKKAALSGSGFFGGSP